MLVELRVKNFKSYKDEQVFSMVAAGVKDDSLPDNLIKVELPRDGKLNLVSAAAIYGPNASGKSNLIDAIKFIENMVVGFSDKRPMRRKLGIPIEPFVLSKETENAPSEFEIIFIQEKVRYQYGFIVDRQKVHEEWLLAYPEGSPQRWFERKIVDPHAEKPEYEWYFPRNHKKKRNDIKDKTRPDNLFLPVAFEFNDEPLTVVYNWFQEKLVYLFVDDLSEELDANKNEKVPYSIKSIHLVDNDVSAKERIANLLRQADLGIADLELETVDFSADQLPSTLPDEMRERLTTMLADSKQVIINLLHFTDDPNTFKPFRLDRESLGTQRLFYTSGWLLDTLENGHVLFVDELDASLHPLLVKKLIELFGNPYVNSKGAQLIFNTHDATLLDNGLLRRDQFWLVEKQRNGASCIFPLSDFRPRTGEALEKNYLEGRYGATPVIGNLVESR